MSMWWHRGFDHLQIPTHQRRTSRFIDRDFQVRYAAIVMTAAILGAILSFLPISLFLSQNYRIFIDLSNRFAPALMDSLERERIGVISLLFVGFTGLTCFFLVLSFKLTNRIVGPLKVLRNHLRRMSRGHWSMAPIRVRDSDEFRDLIDSYNYFYESFRTSLRRDLEVMKKVKIDPEDRESYRAWRQLVEERCRQLNLKQELPYPILRPITSKPVAGPTGTRQVS